MQALLGIMAMLSMEPVRRPIARRPTSTPTNKTEDDIIIHTEETDIFDRLETEWGDIVGPDYGEGPDKTAVIVMAREESEKTDFLPRQTFKAATPKTDVMEALARAKRRAPKPKSAKTEELKQSQKANRSKAKRRKAKKGYLTRVK